MSPKPKRAHQPDVVQMASPAEPQLAAPASCSMPQPSEPTKTEDKPEDKLQESEVVTNTALDPPPEGEHSEESVEQPDVQSDAASAEGDQRRASASSMELLECPSEEGPSVASQIMSRNEGDTISVEGMVISEEARDGRSDNSGETVTTAT